MKISKTIVIPATALATGAEGEQSAAPKEGDSVSFTVEGKVSKVGDMIAIVPVTINGQPVSDNEAQEDPNAPDEMEKPPSREDLHGWAQQALNG